MATIKVPKMNLKIEVAGKLKLSSHLLLKQS